MGENASKQMKQINWRFKKPNKPQGEKIEQQKSYQGTTQSTENKKDNPKSIQKKEKKHFTFNYFQWHNNKDCS